MPEKNVIDALERDIELLDEFTITLTKDEVADLAQILSKEYQNAGKLLTKFADIIKKAG